MVPTNTNTKTKTKKTKVAALLALIIGLAAAPTVVLAATQAPIVQNTAPLPSTSDSPYTSPRAVSWIVMPNPSWVSPSHKKLVCVSVGQPNRTLSISCDWSSYNAK